MDATGDEYVTGQHPRWLERITRSPRGATLDFLAYLSSMAALAAVYYLTACLGKQLAVAHGNVSPVWPATGVAIAALYLYGLRLIPGVFLGGAIYVFSTGGVWISTLAAGLASGLEALIAWGLVKRILHGHYPFGSPSDIFLYFFGAGILAPAVSAAIGVAGLCAGGMTEWTNFGFLWSNWWLGDLMGALIVGPFLITLFDKHQRHLEKKDAWEAIACFFLLAILALIIFSGATRHIGVWAYPIAYLCVPFLLWPAFRFDRFGAVTASLITCSIAITGTIGGHGPFASFSPDQSLLLLQCFMGILALTLLLIAASVSQRRQVQLSLLRKAEELERSNVDLSQFAYVVSHDLQEPLRMVTTYCQLLEARYHTQLDAQADRMIHYVISGATRMRELVGDLLVYSSFGQARHTLTWIEAAACLNEALTNLETSIREKSALVTYDPLPSVYGHRSQLTMLFQNLISNSLKYCTQTQPAVHVSGTTTEPGWTFSVKDNGIGIALEHQTKIFLLFQRLHSRHEYCGTGMGLAICKRIVEQHGGKIWVHSKEGDGSTFLFSLHAKGGSACASAHQNAQPKSS